MVAFSFYCEQYVGMLFEYVDTMYVNCMLDVD
jgi:hypothetical protein